MQSLLFGPDVDAVNVQILFSRIILNNSFDGFLPYCIFWAKSRKKPFKTIH